MVSSVEFGRDLSGNARAAHAIPVQPEIGENPVPSGRLRIEVQKVSEGGVSRSQGLYGILPRRNPSGLRPRVYLDTSFLNRPFDDQSQVRIKLETEAFLAILARIEGGSFELVGSSVLNYEVDANPSRERRERLRTFLDLARHFVEADDLLKARAIELSELGFRALDALHVAAAERASDYLLTVDDQLLTKAFALAATVRVKVIGALDFVLLEELRSG